jgi:hypothetical protein
MAKTYKQVRVSTATYKKLLTLKAHFIDFHEVNFSFDDVISDLLDDVDWEVAKGTKN